MALSRLFSSILKPTRLSRSFGSFKSFESKAFLNSIANQTDFAFRISKHVASAHAANSNFAFSPVSIHAILSLIAAGSKGRALNQLLSVVGSSGAADLNALSSQIIAHVLADGSAGGGPKLSFANGVWLDASLSLKPAFKEIVTRDYKAESKLVDFQRKADQVRADVNSWVENVTVGLIKELLPPGSVDSESRLVFCNALYFKGAWTEKFNASKTKHSKFYLLNGSSVQVPFMTTKEEQYLCSYDGFSVLELPYRQGGGRSPFPQDWDRRQFSMCIFLPDAKDGLWDLSEKLSSESGFLDRHLPQQKVSVGKFKLPKFKISFAFEVSGVLQDMGLVLPFTEDGGLTGMVDSPVGRSPYVTSIFHKSFIEVNEGGTEAAAATAAFLAGCALGSRPLGPLDFVADHPFLFVIREEMTGVVLFTGHVLNPSLEG